MNIYPRSNSNIPNEITNTENNIANISSKLVHNKLLKIEHKAIPIDSKLKLFINGYIIDCTISELGFTTYPTTGGFYVHLLYDGDNLISSAGGTYTSAIEKLDDIASSDTDKSHYLYIAATDISNTTPPTTVSPSLNAEDIYVKGSDNNRPLTEDGNPYYYNSMSSKGMSLDEFLSKFIISDGQL